MHAVHDNSSPQNAAIKIALLACVLAGCADSPSKDGEAAKDTYACQLAGERLVIRFDGDEARLLMPDGSRVVLYQVPMGSGIRYTNGTLDLRGKGAELQLTRNGTLSPLVDCKPYVLPK